MTHRLAQALRLAVALLVAVMNAGCLSFGEPPMAQTYYVLEDVQRAQEVPTWVPIRRALLIAASPADPLADSRALVFSRTQGQRAHYQFAAWTQRPSQRITELLAQRFAQQAMFTSTALLGSGVTGDLLLSLGLEDFYHDVTSAPGEARVAIEAKLIDSDKHTLLARERFTASSPVERENAAGAAAALSVSLGKIFDALVPWAAQTVQKQHGRLDAARTP